MEKLKKLRSTGTALPVCLIKTKYQELDVLIRCILYGYFRICPEEAPSLIVSDGDDSVILSSPDTGLTELLERPFSSEALLDCAIRISSNSHCLRFSSDPERHTAVLGTESVQLTGVEFKLYSAILKNGANYTSAKELSLEVWGRYDRNLCTVYISYLRRKLDRAFGDGTIVTSRGKGYRLRDVK